MGILLLERVKIIFPQNFIKFLNFIIVNDLTNFDI